MAFASKSLRIVIASVALLFPAGQTGAQGVPLPPPLTLPNDTQDTSRCDGKKDYMDAPSVRLAAIPRVQGTTFAVEVMFNRLYATSLDGNRLFVYQLDDQSLTEMAALPLEGKIGLRFDHLKAGKHRFIYAITTPAIVGKDVAHGIVCFSIPETAP
jgi:hypothetical protein